MAMPGETGIIPVYQKRFDSKEGCIVARELVDREDVDGVIARCVPVVYGQDVGGKKKNE